MFCVRVSLFFILYCKSDVFVEVLNIPVRSFILLLSKHKGSIKRRSQSNGAV